MNPIQDPLVSIIVPAFNAEKFIDKSLVTVASQTFTDYELVVVDDGSMDKTSIVVTEFIKKNNLRGRCITQSNKKIAAALNRGIMESTGKWVAILDHDDFWRPKKLERMVKVILKNENYELYWHHIKILNEARNFVPKAPAFRTDNPYFDLLFHGFTIAPSSVLFSKKTWLKLGGFCEDENLYTVQDFDFWLRCAGEGKILFVPEILAEVTRHESSTSQKFVVLHHERMEHLVKRHLSSYFKNTNSLDWPRIGRKRLATVYRSCLIQLMKYRKEIEEQKKAAMLMLKTCPTDWKNILQWARWKVSGLWKY